MLFARQLTSDPMFEVQSLSFRALLTKLETCFSSQTHTLPQLMCCKVHSGYINSLVTPCTFQSGERQAGSSVQKKNERSVFAVDAGQRDQCICDSHFSMF